MSLGSIVSDAIGSAFGNYSGASVEGFLSKFADSQGRYVNQLNPKSCFDVKFLFHPNIDDFTKNKNNSSSGSSLLNSLANVGSSLLNSGIGALQNSLNNATGGVLASLMSLANKSIIQQQKEYSKSNAGKYSFLNYLAVAEMHDSGDQGILGSILGGQSGSPKGMLELDLTYYTQEIQIPQLQMSESTGSTTMVGKFPLNGSYIQPSSNDLMFTMLNTSMPLFEFLFLPWMRECTLPNWFYQTQPYTTATVTIDFRKIGCDMQYVFEGIRPKSIYMIQPNQSQDGSELTRQAVFTFDFMYVTSKEMNPIESIGDKLLQTASVLGSSVSKMMNF